VTRINDVTKNAREQAALQQKFSCFVAISKYWDFQAGDKCRSVVVLRHLVNDYNYQLMRLAAA
jgi:hypothetical protein